MNIDFIGREMIGKLRKQAASEMKRARIISRFVIRRAKEVNERLDRLEVVAGCNIRKIASLARSMTTCLALFKVLGFRIDKTDEAVRELEVYSRKSMNNIKSIEEDMEDRSSYFNTLWQHIRRTEGEISLCNSSIRRLQDKIDYLCKANVKLQDKVYALEKLHSTKIDAFAYYEPPPSIKECEKSMKEADKTGEVEKF